MRFQHIKNQLEHVPDQFTPVWKWRVVEEGKESNGLSEGETGPRELSKQRLAKREFLRHLLPEIVTNKDIDPALDFSLDDVSFARPPSETGHRH